MILTDTGPIVALIDPNVKHYSRCLTILEKTTDVLVCPAACFTEAMHLVYRAGGYRYQRDLWLLREEGVIAIHEAIQPEYDRMAALMAKYADAPMDLADAAVVAAAEQLHLNQVFTLDRHFYSYILSNSQSLEVIGIDRT